jgi:hypothetical protein
MAGLRAGHPVDARLRVEDSNGGRAENKESSLATLERWVAGSSPAMVKGVG